MLIPENAQREMESLIKQEFDRVNKTDNGRPMTLREMEYLVSDVGRRLHEGLLEVVIEEQKTRLAPGKKNCPQCQQAWKSEGIRPRTILTLHGVHTIRRRYYRCPSCEYSECPEDESLEIIPGKLSAALAEKACLVAALTPFDRAADVLYRLTGIQISADCLEAAAIRKGMEVYAEERRTAELPVEKMPTASEAPSRVYFLADGAMLNTRSEGWKENKLGMVFSEENMEKTGSGEQERIRIRKKDFVTSFAEGIRPMNKLLRLLAARNGAYQAGEVVVVSDGAPWIENVFGEMFKELTHILDWYHAVEHLWTCANAVFGKGSEQASQWVKRYKDLLWKGSVEELLTDLFAEAATARDQTPLLELHSYLRTRRHMIRYNEFRERGLFIGSGAIESANKYVIQSRLKRAGMRWSIPGANAIAHLSAAYMADRWDPLWARRPAA